MSKASQYTRIGVPIQLDSSEWNLSRGLTIVALIIGIIGTVFGIVAFTLTLVYDGQNVKSISGVHPNAGEVTELAGLGISVVPNALTHQITIANTGVLSDIAGPGISVSSATGDVTIGNTGVLQLLAGPAISVSAPTGTVTIGNTGVRSAIAGTAIGVSSSTGDVTFTNTGVTSALVTGAGISVSSATGAVTFSNTGVTDLSASSGLSVTASTGSVDVRHELTRLTQLGYGSPLGPQVSYTASTANVSDNTWTSVGYNTNDFEIVPGDDGVGNFGNHWRVPSDGTYTVTVAYDIAINETDVESNQAISVSIVLNATTALPSSGYIPIGGFQTLTISTGTNSNTGLRNFENSLTTSFHACSGCPVETGNGLSVHFIHAHSSTTALTPIDITSAAFRIQIMKTI